MGSVEYLLPLEPIRLGSYCSYNYYSVVCTVYITVPEFSGRLRLEEGCYECTFLKSLATEKA